MIVQRVHRNCPKLLQESLVIAKKMYVHGPIQAMLAANNEPNSCPSVAPAPTKPNNLEPD